MWARQSDVSLEEQLPPPSVMTSKTLCAGHPSGCEAAVHAKRQVSKAPDTDAISLSTCVQFAALLNIHQLCPALSKALINTYREDVQLFIDGEVLLSQEGTTQGDPLAMAMYTIAITPLIHRLEDRATKQVWFADDATASGSLRLGGIASRQ